MYNPRRGTGRSSVRVLVALLPRLATIRVTGRWPLAVFGRGDLPAVLSQCSLCGVQDIGIEHLLCFCPAVDDLFTTWLPWHSRGDWVTLQEVLFAGRTSEGVGLARSRISFVGSASARFAEAFVG